MKRRRYVFKLLLFVLAGAIVNVAVAVAFSQFEVPRGTLLDAKLDDAESRSIAIQFLKEPITGRTGAELYQIMVGVDLIFIGTNSPSLGECHLWVSRAGLPMRALSGGWVSSQGGNRIIGRNEIGPFTILAKPLWPGFAINTIFYAAVLWVLFAVPGRVRRWRRIKRGQCASCGYSLRGSGGVSDTCPECGNIHAIEH